MPGQGNFCNRCGAPLAAALPTTPAPRRRSRAPLVLAGLVLVGAGAGGAYVALRGVPGGGDGGAARPKRPPPAIGKPDTENLPPRVVKLTAAASRVEVGGSTSLTATITDPENDPYYAWWSASCGVIAPRAGAPGQALFLAPSTPGPCAITVEIQDHELRRPRRLQYTIVVDGAGA